ncbi:MAG: hypothetical protein ACPGXK_08970 [Phycisphaerae bacterium]
MAPDPWGMAPDPWGMATWFTAVGMAPATLASKAVYYAMVR